MAKSFSDRLAAAIRAKQTPTLVGIDPRWKQLPQPLREKHGGDAASLHQQASAFFEFSRAVIEVVAPLVPAVKPQAAFFEQLGPAGMQALYEVIQYAREKQLLVILDGKRNDIGSTAAAYAEAYLRREQPAAWGADALTVSPYLGRDSIEPFVDVCREHGSGIFVLVKTSNPGGGMFQDLTADGEPIYQHVSKFVNDLAQETAGECGLGDIGAVVGATYPEQLARLRDSMPSTWILIPGYGAQGGGAADVAAGFRDDGLGAVVNSSRGIIFAYSNERFASAAESDWQKAIELAAIDMIEQLRAATPAGKL